MEEKLSDGPRGFCIYSLYIIHTHFWLSLWLSQPDYSLILHYNYYIINIKHNHILITGKIHIIRSNTFLHLKTYTCTNIEFFITIVLISALTNLLFLHCKLLHSIYYSRVQTYYYKCAFISIYINNYNCEIFDTKPAKQQHKCLKSPRPVSGGLKCSGWCAVWF